MSSTTHKDKVGAIILGNDYQALGVVRSLAEHHIPTFVLADEIGIARYSKYCDNAVVERDLLDEKNFAERLVSIADQYGLDGWVLFPNNDQTVVLVAQEYEQLTERFRVFTPPWPITKQFIYKRLTYALAKEHAVPFPRGYPTQSLQDLLASQPTFPMVLKPSVRTQFFPVSKCKAYRVDTEEELKERFSYMASIVDPQEIVAQELIEGGAHNLYSYAVFFDGQKIIAGIAGHRIRQHPMDFGQATTYAEAVSIPELYEPTQRLLRAMKYYGVAEVEYMWDEREGVYKFIEVNGRPWGWHTLAKAAGVNIPYLVFSHMLKQDIAPVEYKDHMKWMRLLTDIPTAANEILKGNLSVPVYLRQLLSRKECAVFSWRDPVPFFTELVLAPLLWWKRGF